MAVYRLTPIEGTQNFDQWQNSSLKPQCLWVQAADEHDARQQVASATTVGGELLPARKWAPPWTDPALVSCGYDETRVVPSGIIRVKSPASRPVRIGRRDVELYA